MFSSNYFNEVDAQKTGEPDLFHFNSIPNQIFFFFFQEQGNSFWLVAMNVKLG